MFIFVLNLFEQNIVYSIQPSGKVLYHLNAPITSVTGADVPMQYTKSLEISALHQINNIVDADKKLLGY